MNLGGKLDKAQGKGLQGWMNNPIKAVGNKMIKNKGDDMGRIEDMGVILKEKKIHERKTPKEQHKTQKWTSAKKSLTCRVPWHVPIEEKMIEKQRNVKAIKRMNKRTWRP